MRDSFKSTINQIKHQGHGAAMKDWAPPRLAVRWPTSRNSVLSRTAYLVLWFSALTTSISFPAACTSSKGKNNSDETPAHQTGDVMESTNLPSSQDLLIDLRWESASMPPPDFRAYEIHIGPATQAIAKLWTQRGDDAPPETQITFDLTTEQLHRLKSLAMPLMDFEKAFLSEPFVGGELVSLTIALGERSTTIPPGLSHQQATSLVPLYRAVMETVPSASRALFPRWQLADATPRFEH